MPNKSIINYFKINHLCVIVETKGLAVAATGCAAVAVHVVSDPMVFPEVE